MVHIYKKILKTPMSGLVKYSEFIEKWESWECCFVKMYTMYDKNFLVGTKIKSAQFIRNISLSKDTVLWKCGSNYVYILYDFYNYRRKLNFSNKNDYQKFHEIYALWHMNNKPNKIMSV